MLDRLEGTLLSTHVKMNRLEQVEQDFTGEEGAESKTETKHERPDRPVAERRASPRSDQDTASRRMTLSRSVMKIANWVASPPRAKPIGEASHD